MLSLGPTLADLPGDAQHAILSAIGLEAKLTASDGEVNDYFGNSVAVSGDTIVVGDRYATVGVNRTWGAAWEGAAYVFIRSGPNWTDMTEVAKLTASDGGAGMGLGSSVSISGDTIVVGADNAPIGHNLYQGAAYVFTKPASGWHNMTETAKLTASDGSAADFFGCSVSTSGNTVVVGAKDNCAGGVNCRGAAYVFTEPGAGWQNMTQTAKLLASDGQAYDDFGVSVSISGNTVVVGATELGSVDPDDSHLPGAAYVFTKPGTGWTNMTQTAKLTPSDGVGGDEFGTSVSISGNTVVVGSLYTIVNGCCSGAAYVFTEAGSGWRNMTQSAKLAPSDGRTYDSFGNSVSISANTIVVGSPGPDWGTMHQGAAYVFDRPGSGWASMTETAKLTAPDGVKNDQFGVAVAIDGNTMVAGATAAKINVNNNQGAAYVMGVPTGATGVTPIGVQAPAITAISPSQGPAAGRTTVTIQGTFLANATAVHFGKTAGKIVSDSASQIVVLSPAGAGTVDVTVTTSAGTSAVLAADRFTYVAAPTVSRISPSSGPTRGGTKVTITGKNLGNATAVMFGTVAVTSFLKDTATQIVVLAPAGKAGTVDVRVVTAGGASATLSADRFRYIGAAHAVAAAAALPPVSALPILPMAVAPGGSLLARTANDTAILAILADAYPGWKVGRGG